VLARGAALDRTTGPAGLADETRFVLMLIWRGDAPLDVADDPALWLDSDFFSWVDPPPTSLLPDLPVTLRVRAEPGTLAVGGHQRAVLQVPVEGGASAFELTLHAAVPPPLRMVLSGDDGYTAVSDSYGLTLDASVPAGASPQTMGPTTWGAGRFFRASRDGTGWASPGFYENSADGLTWARALANPAFRADYCLYGLGRFVCSREDVFSWSVGGDVVVHEATRYGSLTQGFAFDGTRFIAVGRGGRRALSLDGATLVDTPAQPDAQWLNAVAATPDRIVVAGGNDRWVVGVSTDAGQTWRDQEICRSQYASLTSAGQIGGRWLIAGNSGNDGVCGSGVLASDDGENFEFAPPSDDTRGLRILGVHAGFMFGLRDDRGTQTLIRSRDARTWERGIVFPPGSRIRSLALEGAPRPPPPEAPAPGGEGGAEVPPGGPDAPCAGRVALSLADAPLPADAPGSLGRTPAWSVSQTYALALRNDCAQDVFLLGAPDTWLTGEGFRVASLPPVRLLAGEAATFEVGFTPGDTGLARATLRIPHSAGGPLVRTLEVTVDAPRPVLLYGAGRRTTVTFDGAESFAVNGWENLEAHDDTLQRGGCWGPAGFVTVGGNALRSTWQSADARAWTPGSDGNGFIGGCAGSPEMYVAAGGAGALATSLDGVNWARTHTDFDTHLRDVAYGDGAFVAVGAGRAATTFDGQGWAYDTETPGVTLERIGFATTSAGVPTFVAIGAGGWVGTSADAGATWLHQQVGAGAFGGRVVFVGGRFLIGNGAELYTSPDGFAFTLQGAAGVVPVAGAGRLVVGVRGNAIWRSTDAGQTWSEVLPAGDGPGFLGGVAAGEMP
jgi:hypothetical protein